MNIETKYKAGDKVWFVNFSFKKDCFVPEENKIDRVVIHIMKNGNIKVIYFIDYLSFIGFYEDQLYATEEECQQECDRRNSAEGFPKTKSRRICERRNEI